MITLWLEEIEYRNIFFACQEITKIPAFLDRPPTQEEIDASPALSALQALKYEETDPRGNISYSLIKL